MIQKLTKDEIVWRFDVLIRHLDRVLEDKADEYCENNKSEIVSSNLREQICASILYLNKVGAFTLTTGKHISDTACFSATKFECTESSNNIDEDDVWGSEDINNTISIPNIFSDDDSNDSVVFLEINFPENQLGDLCKDMMNLLCQWNDFDIDVINMVIFMQCYFTEELNIYATCVWTIFLGIFEVDHWENRNQIPWDISDIMQSLLTKRNERIGNLYDPFVRTGMNFLLSHDKYYGHTDNLRYFNAIRLINGILGLDWENIEFGSCIKDWDPKNSNTIVATPKLAQQIQIRNDKYISIGEWLLDKMQSSLTLVNRQAMLILPASILYEKGDIEDLRHALSVANLLDVVILLPPNVFPESGTSTTILLLSSERETNEDVWMIDLSNARMKHEDEEDEDSRLLVDSQEAFRIINDEDSQYFRKVKSSDIEAMNYNWYAPSYLKSEADVPVGYIKLKIGDILQDTNECHFFAMGNYALLTEDKLKSDPFADNRVFADMAPEKIDFDEVTNSLVQYKKTNEKEDEKPLMQLLNAVNSNPPENIYYYSDILVVDLNETLQTAWFEAINHFSSIKVNRKFNCYHVNKDEYDVDYLRLLLANVIKEIKDTITEGGSITLPYILNTEVTIPMSIDEQRKKYEEAKLNHLIDKARKEGLDEAISRMKDEYMNEVHMRKHDMKPFLSQLDSQAKIIDFYLDKIEGNDDIVAAMHAKVHSMLESVNELKKHLNRLTEEDIYGKPERTDIKVSLSALIGDFENYHVDLQIDELALTEAKIANAEVMISPVDFSTLTHTIIENAVKHAFVDKNTLYNLMISLTVNKDKQMFVIDFKNDGEPMPIGMTKYRYGLKGEKGARSEGSGLGGYRVKSITQHYGGDYDVITRTTANNTVSNKAPEKIGGHKRNGHWRYKNNGTTTWSSPCYVKSHWRVYEGEMTSSLVTTIRVELPIYRSNEKI